MFENRRSMTGPVELFEQCKRSSKSAIPFPPAGSHKTPPTGGRSHDRFRAQCLLCTNANSFYCTWHNGRGMREYGVPDRTRSLPTTIGHPSSSKGLRPSTIAQCACEYKY
ncbi:uncharacterized protein LOC121598723 [Anopheles merus]|uniref:uncharacterized protein LOC121598723 n=1 Tax=Anopheles merus TaxID=30066 RepID=UPI001BE3E08F|nr:uncharacterized protein LOC121598723 [Anopheles merus]